MKIERRKPAARELAEITSLRPLARRVLDRGESKRPEKRRRMHGGGGG